MRIEATKRRPMTLARKRRIWKRCEGKCTGCGDPVPLTGAVRYDHWNPLWFGSPDEDSEVDARCLKCDAPKTASDQRAIAKTKRLIRKSGPPELRKKAKRIHGRGFQKGLSRGFDGVVRPR